jgi:hypothetical protein
VTRIRTIAAVTLGPLAGAAIVLCACGGGSGGASEEALVEAATDGAQALLDRDWDTAYGLFSERCREQVSRDDFEEQTTFVILLAEGFFEVEWDELELDEVTVTRLEGDEGEVRVRVVRADGEPLSEDEEDPEPWVFEDGEWRSDDCDDFGEDGLSADESPSPEATGPGSNRDEAVRMGTAHEFGGWRITVTDVLLDATDVVLEEDEFNDEPAPGNQFVLVTLEAEYIGEEEPGNLGDLDFQVVGPSNVAYDFNADCGFTIPDGIEVFRDVFRGGTLTGNLCWSVNTEDVGDLQMYAEETFELDGGQGWWDLSP